MSLIFPFMVRQGEQHHITEIDVSVPPALTITDETGAVWTLGFTFGPAPRGEFAFNVLRDGRETGEFASRIERRNSRVRIFTAAGWKQLFTTKVEATTVYGIGAKCKQVVAEPGPITVRIARDTHPDGLEAVFDFYPQSGGTADLNRRPIVCPSGTWLMATVRPASVAPAVEVVAAVGSRSLRAIPVTSVTLEEQDDE